MICTLANSLWLAGCISESARFRGGVRQVAQEQQEILRRILAANAGTEFGLRHGFSSTGSPGDYQRRVPLRDFDQYREWIDRAAAGAPNVLTRERVVLFEPSSGSAGATKWIPYTRSLQQEFQNGIRAWIADVFLHSPGLLAGQAYWSVSPVIARCQHTSGGIPVGFEDDASYVGGWQRRLVKSVMAVPGEAQLVSDLDAFRYITLLFLARSRDLRLISIWSPTFLSLLLDRLPELGDRIVYDLERGTIGTANIPDTLGQCFYADPRRSREVRLALRASAAQERHARLWPKLGLISCWKDANSAAPAARLAALFAHTRMQGKGLISTEGFVSFPLTHRDDSALAIRSHFLEFLPADRAGNLDPERPCLAHQLDPGARYSVVLTTGGGLYRYRLGDVIEVTGHFEGCPLIRFIGRHAYVSDWFGEKLSDAHVSHVLQNAFRTLAMVPSFAMLACETDLSPARYVLYIDTSEQDPLLHRAAAIVDAGLCENFHYSYARQLGQLACVQPFRAAAAASVYMAAAVRNGQRAGNVKAPGLDRRDGWSSVFEGRFLTEEPASGVRSQAR